MNPSNNKKYTNPLFTAFSVPDPDVIRGDDGYFYMYSTEHAEHAQCKNFPIMRSSDLVTWKKVGYLFTNETHPHITDNPDSRIWAPSINKVGNKYVCYYSQPEKNYKHAIGVATSDTPWGPFTDHGKLIVMNKASKYLLMHTFIRRMEEITFSGEVSGRSVFWN